MLTSRSSAIAHSLAIEGGVAMKNFARALRVIFRYYGSPQKNFLATPLQPFARTNSYLYSFVPNTVSHWNSLPQELVNASSFNQSCMNMSFSHTVSVLVLVLHSYYMSIHCYCFSHCFCSHLLFITTCPHCTTIIYGFTFILALC